MKKTKFVFTLILIVFLGIGFSLYPFFPIEPYKPTPEGYQCIGCCSYECWLESYNFTMFLRKIIPVISILFIVFLLIIEFFIYKSELESV